MIPNNRPRSDGNEQRRSREEQDAGNFPGFEEYDRGEAGEGGLSPGRKDRQPTDADYDYGQ